MNEDFLIYKALKWEEPMDEYSCYLLWLSYLVYVRISHAAMARTQGVIHHVNDTMASRQCAYTRLWLQW